MAPQSMRQYIVTPQENCFDICRHHSNYFAPFLRLSILRGFSQKRRAEARDDLIALRLILLSPKAFAKSRASGSIKAINDSRRAIALSGRIADLSNQSIDSLIRDGFEPSRTSHFHNQARPCATTPFGKAR
jgi:hypothetical protein